MRRAKYTQQKTATLNDVCHTLPALIDDDTEADEEAENEDELRKRQLKE
jgi:hypothetical protein